MHTNCLFQAWAHGQAREHACRSAKSDDAFSKADTESDVLVQTDWQQLGQF